VAMKEYSLENIRNITLLGHSGSGKTSLGEAVLYTGGVTNRLGSVEGWEHDFETMNPKR